MSVSAFACIVRLCKPEDAARVLEMLPAERRIALEAELKSIAGLSITETRNMLIELRKEQLKAQRARVQEQFHRPLDHASPRLVAWLSRPF